RTSTPSRAPARPTRENPASKPGRRSISVLGRLFEDCTNARMHQCTNAPTAEVGMISCRRAAWFAFAAWFALVHFCIGAFSTAALSAETIDRVLAIVAGQLITLSDVTAVRELGLEGAASQTRAADPVRAILNTLIDRELVLAEVERYAPSEPLPEAIDREAARVRT